MQIQANLSAMNPLLDYTEPALSNLVAIRHMWRQGQISEVNFFFEKNQR